jgi:L-2,4-diaminobutyrate decarboxylase
MTDRLRQAYDPERFREQGHQLIDSLADYLANMQHDPRIAVLPGQSPDDRLENWQADYEQSPDEQVNRFWEVVVQQSMHLHHPHYVGHQVAPPAPVAALAGLVSNFLNNGMAVYEMGPVSSVLERIVIQQIANAVGYGLGAGGLMTSGGTLSNLTALLAARQHQVPGSWQQGATEPLALLVSEQAHYCIDRAVKVMGWGEDGVVKVPTDEHFRMQVDQLKARFQQTQSNGRRVIAVVGSACTTATGSYDPLDAIADFCQQRKLWFHVDGAHGAPAAFSSKYQPLVKGLKRADSITIDFHKMMLTPALSTGLLFKDESLSYQTFAQRASYLLSDDEGEWFNSGKRTFECTKRMMSLQIYSILRTYGPKIFAENVDYLYDLASTFARMIEQRPTLELALSPQANIVCFRYVGSVATDALDQLNAVIRQEMLDDGRFYLVQTQLRGQLYLRTTLMNVFTTEAVLSKLLDEVEAVGKRISALLS